MTYIPDLEPYTYDSAHRQKSNPKLLAVGWLDPRFPFTKGPVDPVILERLVRLKANPVNLMRGFHMCPFCEYDGPKDSSTDPTRRGNGEIRVPGENGIVYAAPVLICHYIQAHEYSPPHEFIDAVRKSASSSEPTKIAIVAAIERELQPLVRSWRAVKSSHEGRELTFYESDYAVAVCGGMGGEYGRRAAEAVIRKYSPEIIISAGIAGALVPELHVGDTVFPAVVIDAGDGSRHQSAIRDAALGKAPLARTILISSPDVAGAAQKRQLAKSYGAHVVDMEGASVARAAQIHNLPFLAIKAISDDVNFELAEVNRFIRNGQFETKLFVLFLLFRPWLWLKMIRLARNTQLASHNLCAWLRESALTNTIIPGAISPHQS
ncbi:MAG: 5'-methylthioadenosine/S-adenosylhomocysteine nucleosidase [Terriglobales bacterium]